MLPDDDDVRPDPDVDLADLDRDTLRELRSLGLVGNRVGKHLLTAAAVVDDDPEEALRQLRAAVRRGARLPVVRETAGVVAYAAGDFALALRELRTATRLGVGPHLLPLIVDCERALGRPDRALELASAAEGLDADTRIELAIVVSGIHRDAGDPAGALTAVDVAEAGASAPAALRLRYARAEALLAGGEEDAADDLFGEVARQDTTGVTDAAERLAGMRGLVFDDLGEDEEFDDDPSPAGPGDGGSVDRFDGPVANPDEGPAGADEVVSFDELEERAAGADEGPAGADGVVSFDGLEERAAGADQGPAGADDGGSVDELDGSAVSPDEVGPDSQLQAGRAGADELTSVDEHDGSAVTPDEVGPGSPDEVGRAGTDEVDGLVADGPEGGGELQERRHQPTLASAEPDPGRGDRDNGDDD